MAAKPKAPKIPTKIGAAIDELYRLVEARRLAEAKVKAAKQLEDAYEAAIFAKFKNAELEGARGRTAQATIEKRDHATIEDYGKLIAYIQKKKAFDLFQRRLSGDAVRSRWAEGETIPGVGKFRTVKLAVRKTKAK